ncbi:hypothetical protein Trydic_g21839 [Trypoxylus dichotomus]
MKDMIYVGFLLITLFSYATASDLLTCSESDQSFHPHPKNYSLFIECNGGISEVLTCIEGLHFDPDRGYCNFPEEANCTADEDNNESVFTCPEDGQSFHPFSKNCTLFIECNNGMSEVLTCIESLHFDPNRGYCNFPEEANCTEEYPSEEDDGNLIACPESGQSFHPHPRNCSLFIECNHGNSEVLACIDGLHFDPTRGYCNFPDEANCKMQQTDDGNKVRDNSSIYRLGSIKLGSDYRKRHERDIKGEQADRSCPPEGQHFFPYPYACSQFIECNDGVYKIVNCIPGLHFNAGLGWCDFPETSGCVESTLPPPTTTEKPKDEGGPVGECPPINGEYVDFLTDSKDCTIFYMCNWGTPIQMQCPSILHFNPTLNVCDWPLDAGCKVAQ